MLLTLLIVISSAIIGLKWFLTKKYGTIDKNNEISVKGKIVLITGANSGVGKATALEFAQRDAHVILACRDPQRAQDAITDIRSQTKKGELVFMKLDLASLESVRRFSKEFNQKYETLDILVNNAAVMLDPEKNLKSKDGFEIHVGVNHLGHFLLTKLLLDKLKKSAPSRIVTVSAIAYDHGSVDNLLSFQKNKNIPIGPKSLLEKLFLNIGPGNKPYCDSKLANALFSQELGRRLEGTGVRTYALCPGIVSTGLADGLDLPKMGYAMLKPILKFFLKTPEQGSWTTMYCALSKDLMNTTGQMYQHCAIWKPENRMELKHKYAKELWDLSEDLVK